MHNSIYKLLKDIKKSAYAMTSGSFMPPEPLPNSVKAKQIEQQEMSSQQAEAAAGPGDPMMQMQKAQEDAVNQLQQTQQQLAQAQAELQNVQMQSQQQMHQVQMDAQQQINKAQMDAEYKLQEEKIKNQKALLSAQEKYTRTSVKAPAAQSHILASQLKRMYKRINSLKVATVQPVNTGIVMPSQNSTIQDHEQKRFSGMPHIGIMPSQRTQQQWNEISEWKRNSNQNDPNFAAIQNNVNAAPTKVPGAFSNYGGELTDYLNNPKEYMKHRNPFGTEGLGGFAWDALGGFTTNINNGVSNLAKGNFAEGIGDLGAGYAGGALTLGPGKALGLAGKGILPKLLTYAGLGTASSMLSPSDENTSAVTPEPTAEQSAQQSAPSMGASNNIFSYQPSAQSLTPAQRYGAMNRELLNSMLPAAQFRKAGTTNSAIKDLPPNDAKVTSNFMANQKSKGLYSPIPILQNTAYFAPHKFKSNVYNPSNQQGYGPVGDFIKQLIFSLVPGVAPQPDWSRVHGGLQNAGSHRIQN